MKLLEGDIGEKLHDIGFGNNFFDEAPKAQTTKIKIDQLLISKVKRLCLK